ncbi:hypothetical protein ACWCXK_38610 [Streptomyces sp. NPDC001739]|uniref:Secreted protein n=1 Tax=Streptomyces siderophoricus TaxID=2802281 RepID=A0ABS1N3T0_9ACTN|nr:hypothetical protein [Streptomyces sp. 9-7]MBL1094726.1 hypothetical protein [Streptomyces sp. 9-7]
MQKSAIKKWSARIAASTVIAATAALVPAAGTQAGTPHRCRLCNHGRGYDTVVESRTQGGHSLRVLAGRPQSVSASAERSNQAVTLYAVQGSGKGLCSYVFAGFSYDFRRGIDITTTGTYGAVSWSRR